MRIITTDTELCYYIAIKLWNRANDAYGPNVLEGREKDFGLHYVRALDIWAASQEKVDALIDQYRLECDLANSGESGHILAAAQKGYEWVLSWDGIPAESWELEALKED